MHSNVNCLLQTFHFQHFRGAGCTHFQGRPVHCKMGKITSLQTAHWILQHSVKLPISQAHTAQGFRTKCKIQEEQLKSTMHFVLYTYSALQREGVGLGGCSRYQGSHNFLPGSHCQGGSLPYSAALEIKTVLALNLAWNSRLANLDPALSNGGIFESKSRNM